MSVSTEVQRTLVKSPPELWAELSNPEALGRHLGTLGEIRITSVEPETKVEWEAEGATGVVSLKQSGWGTKVTLSLTREAAKPEEQPEPVAAEPQPEQVAGPKPVATEPQTEQVAELEPVSAPEPVATEPMTVVVTPEPEPPIAQGQTPIAIEPKSEPIPESVKAQPLVAEPEPLPEQEPRPEREPQPVEEPKRGFFARLFRRRGTKLVEIVELEPEAKLESIADPEPEPALAPEPAPEFRALAAPEPEPTPELKALAAPEPIYPLRPLEPAADLAAELESVEAQMAEETTELLTGVLDRLGAAHHRPFSRG